MIEGENDPRQRGLFDHTPYADGQLPHVKGSDTSRAAAEAAEESAPTIRRSVFRFIRSRGDHGSTDDEIEEVLDLSHQTASARRRELVLLGLVKDSGDRRKTRLGRGATVWVAVGDEP